MITMEQIAAGERVRSNLLEAESGGEWIELLRGSAIGHKKIDAFPTVRASRLRLTILDSVETPLIRNFATYHVTS
ncbi:hypothetical protein GC102_21535 [Paenibacillus sp. LMG 31460]|uniref:Uncharacterized protein n=1 Tax=Paenibacillus germinis TaxID=2654979 RepID=A0ABX1Z4L1_9BACL|nr:hypothetical protein [Paenibacillus germinis]NOU88322.1 hypothetical protein [Paenibacillus germinis]